MDSGGGGGAGRGGDRGGSGEGGSGGSGVAKAPGSASKRGDKPRVRSQIRKRGCRGRSKGKGKDGKKNGKKGSGGKRNSSSGPGSGGGRVGGAGAKIEGVSGSNAMDVSADEGEIGVTGSGKKKRAPRERKNRTVRVTACPHDTQPIMVLISLWDGFNNSALLLPRLFFRHHSRDMSNACASLTHIHSRTRILALSLSLTHSLSLSLSLSLTFALPLSLHLTLSPSQSTLTASDASPHSSQWKPFSEMTWQERLER
jgi:hypothetical protein